MTRHDEIRASYRKLGNSADFYDGIITRSTLIGNWWIPWSGDWTGNSRRNG